MAEIFGVDLGVDPGSFVSGTGIGQTLVMASLIFVVALVASIGIWYYYNSKLYSKTINDFENIGGQGYQFIGKDKARLIKIGDGGEEILYLKNKKQYRTAYGRKMGKNVYWFAKGQDGYFYNVLLGDLDAKMGMLDIEPVDRDMRYMHVAIRKNIQERYNKTSFMDKYGSWIMGGVMMLIFLGGMFFILDQIGNLLGEATSAVAAVERLVEPIQQALGKVDSICSGGSGIS
tara:strand:+ start:115 stop:807 length:693 start_codon:yes stop_codon:yes gene_type:complete